MVFKPAGPSLNIITKISTKEVIKKRKFTAMAVLYSDLSACQQDQATLVKKKKYFRRNF